MADDQGKEGQALSLKEIAEYHEDAVLSLRFYFFNADRFIGDPETRRSEGLKLRIDETSLRSMLITLASIEASFKLDYQFRCENKLEDKLSRAFRDLYKTKQNHVSLDKDIFEGWRAHVPESKSLISELRAAFGLRDWLAHGRYWQPKLGRNFDFEFIYDLAAAVTEEFFDTSATA